MAQPTVSLCHLVFDLLRCCSLAPCVATLEGAASLNTGGYARSIRWSNRRMALAGWGFKFLLTSVQSQKRM